MQSYGCEARMASRISFSGRPSLRLPLQGLDKLYRLGLLKRYSEALPSLLECVSRAPNLRDVYVWLAAMSKLNKPADKPPRCARSSQRAQYSERQNRS